MIIMKYFIEKELLYLVLRGKAGKNWVSLLNIFQKVLMEYGELMKMIIFIIKFKNNF